MIIQLAEHIKMFGEGHRIPTGGFNLVGVDGRRADDRRRGEVAAEQQKWPHKGPWPVVDGSSSGGQAGNGRVGGGKEEKREVYTEGMGLLVLFDWFRGN